MAGIVFVCSLYRIPSYIYIYFMECHIFHRDINVYIYNDVYPHRLYIMCIYIYFFGLAIIAEKAHDTLSFHTTTCCHYYFCCSFFSSVPLWYFHCYKASHTFYGSSKKIALTTEIAQALAIKRFRQWSIYLLKMCHVKEIAGTFWHYCSVWSHIVTFMEYQITQLISNEGIPFIFHISK